MGLHFQRFRICSDHVSPAWTGTPLAQTAEKVRGRDAFHVAVAVVHVRRRGQVALSFASEAFRNDAGDDQEAYQAKGDGQTYQNDETNCHAAACRRFVKTVHQRGLLNGIGTHHQS